MKVVVKPAVERRRNVAFIVAPILASRLTLMTARMSATNDESQQGLKCVFYNKCLVSVCDDDGSDSSALLSVQHEATNTTCPSLLNTPKIVAKR